MLDGERRAQALVDRPGDHWRVPAVAEAYDRCRFANVKGRLYRRLEEGALRDALRGLPSASTVLDAACGTGRVTALLRGQGLRPTGYDISEAMIAVARGRLHALGYRDVVLATGDAGRLPWADGSFEAATCVGLLMHLDAETRVGVLRELARVARARVVVQYGRLHPVNRARALLMGTLPGNVRFCVGEAELRRDLERAGLFERARFWAFRGLSTSVVLVLTRTGRGRAHR
jgi:ubiquinone/menaquinone biosynthesis C-methylase UbiE